MLETSICNYVWNADEDLSEVLIHYGSLFASREELQVLRPKGWLTSTIIDLVSWTLAYDSKFNGLSTTRWYFPASFSGLILVHPPNAEDIIKVFKQQFIRMGSLSDCFKIYIPMNDVNKHWYLCVIDMMDKEARVYDSLPRTKSNLKRINDVNHMISYCSRLFKDSTFTSLVGKPVWELDECKVVVPERVPSQGNGYDCGMFMISFMQTLHITDYKLMRVGEWDRFLLLTDLINHEENTLRKRVCDAAIKHQKTLASVPPNRSQLKVAKMKL